MPLFWDLSLLLSQHFTNFDMLCYHFHSFQNTLSHMLLFRNLLFSFKILGDFAEMILLLISNLVLFSNLSPLNLCLFYRPGCDVCRRPMKSWKECIPATCCKEWSVSWLIVLCVSFMTLLIFCLVYQLLREGDWKFLEYNCAFVYFSFQLFLLHVFCTSIIRLMGSF